MIKHATTKSHYEKYKAMAENLHIRFDPEKKYFGLTRDDLIRYHEHDENLNNIPLRTIDTIAAAMPTRSLSEGVCLVKWCLVFQVIGAEPEFYDPIDRINENRRKSGLPEYK